MKLPKKSYQWAMRHLFIQGDSDLFPPPFEINVIKFNLNEILTILAAVDLHLFDWNVGRRFLVPKGELDFRIGTQLDSLDSLVLTALIYKYGQKIENRRIDFENRRVYSYRFEPTDDGRLYGTGTYWEDFWRDSIELASKPRIGAVAVSDIADYYNQISHHTIENELDAAGLPQQIQKAIKNFIQKQTHKISRGLAVGPHSTHLLAELALNPIDRSLLAKGYNFKRYADDFLIFIEDRDKAEIALLELADTLDKQQKLHIQNRKTHILESDQFIDYARKKLEEEPVNKAEAEILEMINYYTGGDPYTPIMINKLKDDEIALLDESYLVGILEAYLSEEPIEYSRLRNFVRRITQVRTPNALPFIVNNISQFYPIIGVVARYIVASCKEYKGDICELGEAICEALDSPFVQQCKYLSMLLINLFSQSPGLDHINKITKKYNAYSPVVRREIVIAAVRANQVDWIRERKDEIDSTDRWLKRAILVGLSVLPESERDAWLRSIKAGLSGMEKFTVKWCLKKRKLKLGSLSLP